MKKNVILFLSILCCLFSCKTAEKIVYLRDVNSEEAIKTQSVQALKLSAGDKIGVTVTSAATPELAQRYNLSAGSSSNSNIENQRYTIDENGNIDMLGIGRIQVGGLTRSEAAEKIQATFRQKLLRDAVVTVAAYNQYITVLGEVNNPGRIEIDRDNITLLEAIGMAGDLTILGRRDQIKVLRQTGDSSVTYFVDLRSKDILKSPVYNLQQNDIVYVEPNKVRMGQSTNNDNSLRNISMWMSITSMLTSIAVLIFR